MLRMGIIGAENTHTVAIARILNVERAVRGVRVTHLWGETRKLARRAAEAGRIPVIVREPGEMLGRIDCVMADHRDGQYHLPALTPFVEAGIPCFVDKPLCTSLAEAKRFLALRRARKTAVTTFSVLPRQSVVREVQRELKRIGDVTAVHLNGPGHWRSRYSGIFFYGIHQVDIMVELLGTGARTAVLVPNGDASTAVVNYPNGLAVTMSFGAHGFSVSAVGSQGALQREIAMDASPYLSGVRCFVRMFKTGREPHDDRRMLAPVAVLEAMRKSLKAERPIRIGRLE